MAEDVMIGMGTERNDWETVENIVGGPDFNFDCRRSYSGGMPGEFSKSPPAADVGKRVSVYSFKPGKWSEVDRITDALGTYCEEVPANHKMRLIVHHEPKDNTSDLGGTVAVAGTAAEYRELQQACADVIHFVNRSRAQENRIRFWGCLEGDAVRAGYADKFWPGDGVWIGLSWDGYCWDRYYPSRYSMKEVFQRAYDYTVAKGVNFSISETSIGSRFPNRGQWMKNGFDWLRSPDVNAKWVCHWNSSDQFKFDDTELKALSY